MPGNYQVGEQLALAVTFKNPTTGALFDPTTVVMKTLKPTDTGAVSQTVTHDSLGNYHANVTPDVPGRWYYRVTTTGPADAREESFTASSVHAI